VTAIGLFNYWAVIVLMMVGFYTLIARDNLVKKLIGLNIFQTSVIMMYISFGRIKGGTAPILFPAAHGEEVAVTDHAAEVAAEAGEAVAEVVAEVGPAGVEVARAAAEVAQAAAESTRATVEAAGFAAYSNPLPHVLMLTAIVVGVATLALGLALVVRIKEAYGTIEEDEINAMDLAL
jgi:multicomponent Na+:H+ antiporter subunit C